MKPADYFHKLAQLIKIPKVPMVLDFETFYDSEQGYTLKKMSIEEYVRDPRFLVHGLSVKFGDKETRYIAGPQRVAEFLTKVPMTRMHCVAHNTRFDGFILSEIYGIRPYMWSCTMQMAAMVCGNNVKALNLASLASRFLPPELQKDSTALVNVDGKQSLTRDEQRALGTYAKGDADMCYALYLLFSKALEQRPLELPMLDMILRMFTDPKLELDVPLLETIHADEAREKEAAVKDCIAPDIEALRSNPKFATLLEGCGVEPPVKLNDKGKEIFAFAKTDLNFQELAMHEDPVVRKLVAARLRVRSSIEETRAEKYAAVGNRGTWPVALNMSGARMTHRLTGAPDGGGNPQNLSNVDKSRLRYSILPPDDHHLMVIDSSGIDLRCAMHLAGEEEVCEQWKKPAFDLYVTFAAHLFGCALDEVTKTQRKLGKVSVLQLQYKSGAKTFRQIAWNWGVELTLTEAESIVFKYREAFPRIVKAWQVLDYVLRKLANGQSEETWMDRLVRANPQTIAGCPGFDVAGGMPITYPKLGFDYDPRFSRPALMYTTWARDTGAHGPGRNLLHGGKAFGHICQNAARNIVMPQTLAVERWLRSEVHPGCASVMSVHDEGGYVIPNESFKNTTPEDVLEGALEIMRAPPEWWPEITLNAEGGIGECSYGEIK